MTALLDAALAAHAAGLSVVPPAQDGTKRPERAWKQFQIERPDERTLRGWYANGRTGLGVVCGKVSGGLEMLELEGRAVDAGLADELDHLANDAGLGDLLDRIVTGYCERTPSGGLHVLYRCDEGEGNLKLARDEGGGVLIETRGEGGFVIVAPSNGTVHPTGGAWELTDGGFDTIATITPDERRALLYLCRQLDRSTSRDSDPGDRDGIDAEDRHGSRDPLQGAWENGGDSRPGDEFDASRTCHDVLVDAGFTEHHTDGQGVHYTRPDKPKRLGSSATVWADDGTCTPFSSSINAPIEYLDGHHKLTPFRLHAVLHYRGDFSEAAREWRRDHPRPDAGPDLEDLIGGANGVGDQGSEAPGAALPGNATGHRSVRLTPASAIKIRPVQWVWEGRIPVGALTLIGGREGIGKTTLAYTLAADITRGTMNGRYHGEERAVIIAATEDSWEHTIVPRLMAAGANLDLVYRVDVTSSDDVDTTLTLPTDLHGLEQAAVDVGAALILLDPLLSRLHASLDTHKDAEVRRALEPLVSLADRCGAAVGGLIHVNKAVSTDPLTLLMGSRAFAAVARAVLFLMVDPDDEAVRLVGQPKNNLGRTDQPTLKFTIGSRKVADTDEGEVWTGAVEWGGESDRSITDYLADSAAGSETRTAAAEAGDWLYDYLLTQGGRAESAECKREAAKAGHTRDALDRGRTSRKITAEGKGFPRRTWWGLP